MTKRKKIDVAFGDLPRFTLTLLDTHSTFVGSKGEVYYNITVGFDSFKQLLAPIAEEDGGSELNRVVKTFQETVGAMDAEKAAKVQKVMGNKRKGVDRA